MQKECALSFIKPIELDQINQKNREKLVQAAIQITTDDECAENGELQEAWYQVLEAVVSRVDIRFVQQHVMPEIKDMPSLK